MLRAHTVDAPREFGFLITISLSLSLALAFSFLQFYFYFYLYFYSLCLLSSPRFPARNLSSTNVKRFQTRKRTLVTTRHLEKTYCSVLHNLSSRFYYVQCICRVFTPRHSLFACYSLGFYSAFSFGIKNK